MRGSLRLGMVALGVAGVVAAAAPADGQAQGGSSVVTVGSTGAFFGLGGLGASTATDFAVNVRGVLIVSFHGDPGTGCAVRGLCGYSGLVSVQLGNEANLSVDNLPHGKGLSNRATLYLGGSPSGFTVADVDRTAGGVVLGHCVDVQQPFFTAAASGNGLITVSPMQAGADALATRCAGPLYRDVARAVPRATVPVKRLIRRGERIDLSGDRAFAGGGFAGTVHSTIVLDTGGANGGSSSAEAVPPGHKTTRIRTVTEALQVVSASGGLHATIRGTGDPYECRLLDACGMTGAFTAPIAPVHPRANLSAVGPAKRPYRDYLKALGLGATGDARGIAVYGNITSSGGSFTESIDQGGRCSDTAPIGGTNVSLDVNKGLLVADYALDGQLRTRCPGPLFSIGPANLATGRVSIGALRQGTFTLRLGGSLALGDEGYSVSTHSRLSLVLRRGPVTQHVTTEPAGLPPST